MATVTPLHPVRVLKPAPGTPVKAVPSTPVRVERSRDISNALTVSRLRSTRTAKDTIPNIISPPPQTLDGTWDRQITKGAIIPDISVDLHGSGLSGAYARLDGALEQAIAQKLRVVLLVTGRARAHDRASGEGRGAIASVVRDWLSASRHAKAIAAVRNAHPRHGGAGALYIVLKR